MSPKGKKEEEKETRPIHTLNLDDLAPDPHVLTYRGVEYELKVLSTREFLKLRKTLDVLREAEGEEGVEMTAESVEAAIEFVKPVIPEFPEEDLDNMSTAQLTALFQFCSEVIRGPSLEEIKKVQSTKKGD